MRKGITMMLRRLLVILAISVHGILPLCSGGDVFAQGRPQLTVLYDNYAGNKGLIPANGFSCIIRGTEKTILFDTGSNKDILLTNMKMLGINPEIIDYIVISHDHDDHTGGLLAILEANPRVTVFLPSGFADYNLVSKIQAYGVKMVTVKQPTAICKGVYSTGAMQGMELSEQSLVLNSQSGLILLCGCSHPGITNIVEESMRMFKKKIIFVFGGFHYKSAPETRILDTIKKFVSYGVVGVGGSHCSGDEMLRSLKTFYGKTYVPMVVGTTITLR